MGITQQVHIEDPSVRDRWQERYGDKEIKPIVFKETKDFVQIGDEIYSIDELRKAHIEHPQPKSHPFKPNHYCNLKDLQEIRACHEKHRKIGK